ncbi:MAG: hypothetical protein ACM3O3_05100 [Syntrophothermus sp.]
MPEYNDYVEDLKKGDKIECIHLTQFKNRKWEKLAGTVKNINDCKIQLSNISTGSGLVDTTKDFFINIYTIDKGGIKFRIV